MKIPKIPEIPKITKISVFVYFVVAAILIATIIIGWLMFGGKGPLDVTLDKGVKAKFNATMRNTEISREKDGKPLWWFNVDEVVSDQTNGKTYLKGIKGKTYRSDGSYFDISANAGEMITGSQDFDLNDNVHVTHSRDGSKLLADKVSWNDKSGEITAEGHVQLWKSEWYAKADKGICSNNFNKLHFFGNSYVERR